MRLTLQDVSVALSTCRMIRVQSDTGSIWMHQDDQVMTPTVAYYGMWEEETARWLREVLLPGATMLDIGANVGYDNLVSARAVGSSGHVIALEPDPHNYALLCANLWDSQLGHVSPLRVAAADTTGTTSLWLCNGNRGDHRTFYSSPARTRIEVPCVQVDDLLQADVTVDVVKIDTQGTDHRVVEGMLALISRCRPRLHIEFWPDGIVESGGDPLAILAFYRSLGYMFRLLEVPTIRSASHDDETCVAVARTCPGGYCSLIFTP